MNEIMQMFAGGGQGIQEDQMGGHVENMLQQASGDHIQGALGSTLGNLGPQGFGSSIEQAAQNMGPSQKQGLFSMFSQAIEGGGGSVPGALSSLGIGGNAQGGSNLSAGELGSLAQHVLQNHGNALQSVMGNQMGGSGGSGITSMLGNPMVRQMGMNLAQQLMGGHGL